MLRLPQQHVVQGTQNKASIKVLQIGDYDMPSILLNLQEDGGNAPAQHLWGYIQFGQYNLDVDLLRFKKYGFLKRLSKKIKVLGDLDQQLRALRCAHRYDVLYSTHNLTTVLLSASRFWGLLRKPMIAISYQAPRSRSSFWKFFARVFIGGNDRILCLSEALMRDFQELGISKHKLGLVEWGVDMPFYAPKASTPDATLTPRNQRFILSSGKTYRDYWTLSEAFRNIDGRLVICGGGRVGAADLTQAPPDCVELISTIIPWQELIALHHQAYAVAIPLLDDRSKFKNAIGFTALTEAMATGKAIIMTRSEYVGIDLEQEGIGLWVEPGDVVGWQRAITYLLDNPDVAQQMGSRAQQLAERQFNLNRFSKQVADCIHEVAPMRLPARSPIPS